MNAVNTANAYKVQQIMTATPEQLTLMLYNGAIRFVHESIDALAAEDYQKAHNSNLRAQDIVREFVCTLDMSIEMSQSLAALYEYIEYNLIEGNIKKDRTHLEQAYEMLKEMRDTWAEAMKLAKVQAPPTQSYQTAAAYR